MYQPFGSLVLDGWPVSWEIVYYIRHFPTFLADQPPVTGFASVQFRVWLLLYLAAMLHGWINSAFWSMAIIDLLFWYLAAVAMLYVVPRLGLPRTAAIPAAVLVAASPLFVSGMWEHVLHPAEFGSLAIGLWAALRILDGPSRQQAATSPNGQPDSAGWYTPARLRHRVIAWLTAVPEWRILWRETAAFGGLLLVLSLTYQYQWFVLPLGAALAMTGRNGSLRRTLAIIAGGAIIYVAGTLLLRGLLILLGLDISVADPYAEASAVAEPHGLLLAQAGTADPRSILTALLPRWDHVRLMLQTYHPVVLWAGLAGLLWTPWRFRLLAAISLAETLVASVTYPTPWMAMGSYPFVYMGAAVACWATATYAVAVVDVVRGRTGGPVWRMASTAYLAQQQTATGVLVLLITVLLTLVLASLTNLDLAGDASFTLAWWGTYSTRPLF